MLSWLDGRLLLYNMFFLLLHRFWNAWIEFKDSIENVLHQNLLIMSPPGLWSGLHGLVQYDRHEYRTFKMLPLLRECLSNPKLDVCWFKTIHRLSSFILEYVRKSSSFLTRRFPHRTGVHLSSHA